MKEIAGKMQRNIQLKPIRLDTSLAIKMSMGGSMFQERALMARSDVWHMIKILKGTHYDKEQVLNAILAAVEPAELTPIKYQVTGEDTYFIARSCGAALDKLCKCNLIIKNGSSDPLILVITLAYALLHDLKFNLKSHLSNAITGRYDVTRKSLDLSKFHRDPELVSVIYCPLTQPRAFSHVLTFVKVSTVDVDEINLQRNELVSLSALETAGITMIRSVDLRHNSLLNMSVLTALKGMPVTTLWLDDNPLCENYSNASKYIESARKYCPNLEQLDGVSVRSSSLQSRILYTKNEKREGLIRKFAEHFFALFDQGDRLVLRGLYCENAIYSMSFGIPGGTAHKLGIGQLSCSRNLKRSLDPKKAQKQAQKQMQHIHCGETNILAALKKIPRCYHEKSTFTYDLMYDDEKYLMVCVGGFVKKLDSPSVILSFNRTFVLVESIDNEYNILNDQYHVDAAPETMTPSSIVMKITYDGFKPSCFSDPERKELISKMEEVSTMNEEWCVSYLDDAKWNLYTAIKTFMADYDASNVPQHAFTR